MESFARARELIDAAHSADPNRLPDGRPAELVYADRMEMAVARLDPQVSSLLRLAARSQHLERWTLARDAYPMDRAGYHRWRRELYTRQANRARELLCAAGVSSAEADEVATWVSKTGLVTNPGTQALEDAACLVFLEYELADFASRHPEYTQEKFVEILRKTWRKMSPRARDIALTLELAPPLRPLVQAAAAAA